MPINGWYADDLTHDQIPPHAPGDQRQPHEVLADAEVATAPAPVEAVVETPAEPVEVPEPDPSV